MLHGIFIFIRISQSSCVMCFIAVVQQNVWQDFIQIPAQKKSVIFLKSEFYVTSTSSWAVPHDDEGHKVLFYKVICYKGSAALTACVCHLYRVMVCSRSGRL